jgi:hypothetical protein
VPTWTKPVTLVSNTNENVNDLNAILDDIYARANGGLDETNVPNLAAAFTTYKHVFAATGIAGASLGAGTYIIAPTDFFLASGTAGTARAMFWFDPARYNANARTTKLALHLAVVTNAVAPGANFTLNMNQIASITGASGVAPGLTVGAGVGGVTITAPGASTVVQALSADFTAPAALQYCLTVVTSAATAAGSSTQCIATLLARQV